MAEPNSIVSTSLVTGSLVGSLRPSQIKYIELFQSAMETQRQAHEAERAKWAAEREELKRRVVGLESMVRDMHWMAPSPQVNDFTKFLSSPSKDLNKHSLPKSPRNIPCNPSDNSLADRPIHLPDPGKQQRPPPSLSRPNPITYSLQVQQAKVSEHPKPSPPAPEETGACFPCHSPLRRRLWGSGPGAFGPFGSYQ